MGHTPGPWVLNGWDIVQRDCGDDFPPLATACNGRKTLPIEETSANARLIAAAPELLEALINCRDWLVCITGHAELEDTERGYLEAATAAIAKAEGRVE